MKLIALPVRDSVTLITPQRQVVSRFTLPTSLEYPGASHLFVSLRLINYPDNEAPLLLLSNLVQASEIYGSELWPIIGFTPNINLAGGRDLVLPLSPSFGNSRFVEVVFVPIADPLPSEASLASLSKVLQNALILVVIEPGRA